MELTKTSLLVNFAPANLQLHYPHRRSTAEGLVLSLYCYHSRVSLKLILKIGPSFSAVVLLETCHSSLFEIYLKYILTIVAPNAAFFPVIFMFNFR
jgi:hypothetical protein